MTAGAPPPAHGLPRAGLRGYAGAMAHDDKHGSDPSIHDDHEGEGRSQMAAASTSPVIAKTHLLVHEAPEPKKRELAPSVQLEAKVLWGPLPPEPKPKPDRVAFTPRVYLMDSRRTEDHRPAKEPVPSIGSMEPGRGRR